ncbi:saccharopine dehydrogenase NADP-binding domain-containing protein [Micromonospora sp. WMMD1102]|uniref:saccharopine dehydrogenase family protein n=1 Tax=Micromonospora sp. WMMD1102 TaxID=3016105 RepID=UPI00241536C5|nr:saccharopine dehydrogenase NADP-binding domain-containing protein [Micromonospora sp. WMMD1102]MDG4786085.1 saccharopine dehydrogenase NADP-binding domain-containing protein [Micromonospora sp. WMMD1102]
MNRRHGRDTAGRIVVVGGYGAVGRVTAETLGQWFPDRVVVAGRDLRRARELTARAPTALRAEAVDVGVPDQVHRMLRGTGLVVMCVERGNETLARECLRRGIHYLDVSASRALLEGIGRLDPLATASGATAALSVGLAPGLTNVLARLCVDRLPDARRVEIAILLGAAGDHGPDSVRWTVAQLGQPVRPPYGFPVRTRTPLPGFGDRSTYWFPFSDQYTLAGTLGVPVATRICFDSPALTGLVFALRSAGLFALLGRLGAEPILNAALSRLHTGTDRFALHVTAADADGRRVCCAATGRQECRATGIVAAHVARRIFLGQTTPGVRHLNQLVDPSAFLAELPTRQLTLHLDGESPTARPRGGR